MPDHAGKLLAHGADLVWGRITMPIPERPACCAACIFSARPAQAKLVRVICGEILDIVVDTRTGSSSFRRWLAVELSEAAWS